jgi:hypothetical protein
MCVMKEAAVGVRELRQNLSVYLRRVEAGEAPSRSSYGPLAGEAAAASPS